MGRCPKAPRSIFTKPFHVFRIGGKISRSPLYYSTQILHPIVQGKPFFFSVLLFEQGLADDFGFGAPEPLGLTVQPTINRIVDFQCENFHESTVIPVCQKGNTNLFSPWV
jgi:hypothetical protein